MFYSNPHRCFQKHVCDPVYVSDGVFRLQSWVRVALLWVFVQTDTCSLSQRARRPFFCPRPEVCLCVCASLSLSDSVFLSPSVFTLTGQSGLGKSTLMNTLFKSKVSRRSVLPASQEKIPKTVEIKSISHGMETTFSSSLSAHRCCSPPTVSHPPISVYIFLLCQPHIVHTACLVAPNNTVAVPYLFSLCTHQH